MRGIVERFTLGAAAMLLAACGEAPAPAPQSAPLVPTFGAEVEADKVAWSANAWSKVMAACPGLSRFRSDLSPSGSPKGYFVSQYFDDKKDALIAVLKVADAPTNKALYGYHAQGNNCYFAMEFPGGGAVHIAKNACQQLCLDRQIERSGEDLRLDL